MSQRRVVVTGLGLLSPVGIGVEESWKAIVAGKSGIGPITQFDASTFPTRIAGEVKGFQPEQYMDRKEVRRNDRFIHFALAAAEMAMKDSGLDMAKEDPERVGAIVGSGMGGLRELEDTHTTLVERGVRKVGPFFTEGYEGFSIDTEADWREAEYLSASGQATLPEIHVAA